MYANDYQAEFPPQNSWLHTKKPTLFIEDITSIVIETLIIGFVNNHCKNDTYNRFTLQQ
jgi:hypothetical protein